MGNVYEHIRVVLKLAAPNLTDRLHPKYVYMQFICDIILLDFPDWLSILSSGFGWSDRPKKRLVS